MGETFASLAGTQSGEQLAFFLALTSAFAHAVFAAINKGGIDPYLNRGAINIAYCLMAAPFAFFVFPLPHPALFTILFFSFVCHVAYEWLQAAAFNRGAFTLVYPIARGTGPLFIAVIAIHVFNETLVSTQWVGLIILSGAIMSLAGINLAENRGHRDMRNRLRPSILFAIGAGICIALYTTIDAYGIRATSNPFTFLAWFFFLGGFGFPVIAWLRYRNMPAKPPVLPLVKRGFIGALIALFSFGTLMLATRIGNVGEAAALRETSIIFATAIGVIFFKETVSFSKLSAILMIALGAVLIEFH